MGSNKILAGAFIAAISTLGFSAMANAALPGFYVGGQLGVGDTHWGSGDINNVASGTYSDTGLAGRFFGGYQFNDYAAVEIGYTQFSEANVRNIINDSGVAVPNGSISEWATDVVAKGILPLDNGFGLYGKLGGAYVKANGSGSVSNATESRINPAFGVGASYDITPNVPVDISWNRIQKVGGSVPSTDLFSIGIAYNFG